MWIWWWIPSGLSKKYFCQKCKEHVHLHEGDIGVTPYDTGEHRRLKERRTNPKLIKLKNPRQV